MTGRMLKRVAALAAAALLVPLGPAVAMTGAEGGQLLAFSGWVGDDTSQSLLTVDSVTHQVRTVAGGGVGDIAWTADGGRLIWIGFDGRTDGGSTLYGSRPDGSERRVLLQGSSLADVTVAPDGTLAVARSDVTASHDCATFPPAPPADITLIDPSGRVHALVGTPGAAWQLRFSPDGRTLTWTAQEGDPCGGGPVRLHLTDVATGLSRTVTGEDRLSGPSFSADGSTVVTAKSDGLGADLVLVDVATASTRRLRTENFAESFPVVSPDGSTIAAVRTEGVPASGVIFRPTAPAHVVLLDLEGRLVRDLGPAPVPAEHLGWSPDGSFLALGGAAFVPDCDGCDHGSAAPAIWVVPADGSAPSRSTTAGGFASAALEVQPVFPSPPAVARRTRHLR